MICTWCQVRVTRFWKPSWTALNPTLLVGLFGLVCSSLVTTVVSWFAGEVGEFLAGRLGKTELAAQTVVINFSMIFYCIPVGLGIGGFTLLTTAEHLWMQSVNNVAFENIEIIALKYRTLSLSHQHHCTLWSLLCDARTIGSACTSRIAQYVGQGSERMAKVVYRLTIIIHIVCGLLTAATYAVFRYQLVRIFTNKDDVTDMAVSLTAWVAFTDIGVNSTRVLIVI